jgi:hypothetical protein
MYRQLKKAGPAMQKISAKTPDGVQMETDVPDVGLKSVREEDWDGM